MSLKPVLMIAAVAVLAVAGWQVFSSNDATATDVKTDTKTEATPEAKAPEAKPAANELLSSEGLVKPELLLEKLPTDVVYGKPDAKHTIVEYASLSCTHCKAFHDTVQKELAAKYIANGDLSLVFRHFPLNPPALRAAQIVECMETNDAKQKMVDALFATQEDWAFVANENVLKVQLLKIAKAGGLSEDAFNGCFGNKALEDKILAFQLRAGQELTVNSTPSIFLDGKRFAGDRSLKSFEDAFKQSGK